MAKARKKKRKHEDDADDEIEVVDEAEDEADEDDAIERDFVMARLAAARTSFQAAIDAIDEALALFVNPDDDDDGGEREELVDTAVEAAGAGTIALQSAETAWGEADESVAALGEPDGDNED